MKYSTGRQTRCKHSTAMEWDEYEKKKRRSRVRYSTGRGAAIRHFSGVLLDGETPEQENQPDRTFKPAKENREFAKKTAKGFKRLMADY